MRPTRCSTTTSNWFGNEHLITQPKSVRSIEVRARTRYTAHPMRDQVTSERGKGEAVGRVVRGLGGWAEEWVEAPAPARTASRQQR